MDISETTRWLVQLALAGTALVGAAWLYLDFAPRLQPEIAVVDRDDRRRLAVVRLTITNTSRVMVHRGPRGVRFHAVPVPLTRGRDHSEFVPLTKDRYDAKDPADKVADWEWSDPLPVFETTRYWYPADRVTIDRVVALPDDGCALHLALQATGRVSPLVRVLLWLRRGDTRLGAHRDVESWTTTLFLLPAPEITPSDRNRRTGSATRTTLVPSPGEPGERERPAAGG